jgi:flagellar hook-basal body complex protein FliE
MSLVTSLINTNVSATGHVQPFAQQLQKARINDVAEESQSPFAAFFNAALNMLGDTNQMIAHQEQMQLDYATGRIDDLLAVQLSMDRASNALNFTVQVTNRVIESYREIMRMQI